MPTKGRKACEMNICEIPTTVRQGPRLTGEHMFQWIVAMEKWKLTVARCQLFWHKPEIQVSMHYSGQVIDVYKTAHAIEFW